MTGQAANSSAAAGGRSGRPSRGRSGGHRGRGRGEQRHPDPPRRLALDVLLAVDQRDAYANLLLPELLGQRGLTGRDSALATELTYGTLRGRGTYDAILAVTCDRDLAALDPPVREVLRLGTHQLLGTRVQAHAAVTTSVNLIKEVAGQRPSGFVNAVLRRVATRDRAAWLDIVAPGRDDDPAGYLSIRHSHPRWIVEAIADALNEPLPGPLTQTEAALAADNERPRVHLCAVPGLSDRHELIGAGCEPARWSEFGGYLSDGDPAAVAAIAAGRAGVQDEASQLAAIALSRAAVDGAQARWLDLCAGPGGKARLLAGLAAQGSARLLAVEVRPHRARLVRDTTAGTGALRRAARDCWRSRCVRTGPAWSGIRPRAPARAASSLPMAPSPPGGRRPSAGYSRTCPARDWVRCGGGRKPGGAVRPTT